MLYFYSGQGEWQLSIDALPQSLLRTGDFLMSALENKEFVLSDPMHLTGVFKLSDKAILELRYTGETSDICLYYIDHPDAPKDIPAELLNDIKRLKHLAHFVPIALLSSRRISLPEVIQCQDANEVINAEVYKDLKIEVATLKARIEKTPPTAKESESEKLLKQIGAMALVLAEKSSKYKRGNAPNALQIANGVQEILDAGLIGNKNLFKGRKGTGSTEVRNSIKDGLDLLQSED